MTWTAVAWVAVAAIVTVELLRWAASLPRIPADELPGPDHDYDGRSASRSPQHASRRGGTIGPEARSGRPIRSPYSETSAVDVDQLMRILADQGAGKLKRERERA